MADWRVSMMKYFRPLLPSGACFHSHCSSKLSKSASVIMSPPPLPRQCSQPSSTAQPLAGKDCFLKLRHPFVVFPSKRRFQPSVFSCCESWLVVVPKARLAVGNTTDKQQIPKTAA